jgi:hypothetical protein
MPRPSRFDHIHPVATHTATAMTPVVPLSKRALNVFNHAVTTHQHLRPADCVMLTAYSQVAARVLASKADDREREKLGRLLIAYGRALKLNAMQRKPVKSDAGPGGHGVTWQQLRGRNVGDEGSGS